MNATFRNPYFPGLETMGDETPTTTTTTTAPSNAASIIDSISRSLTSIATTAIGVFGAQPTTTTPTAPGAPVINVPAPQQAGLSPTMLLAIGIPAAIVLVALTRGGRR